jgi:hypothetical protein
VTAWLPPAGTVPLVGLAVNARSLLVTEVNVRVALPVLVTNSTPRADWPTGTSPNSSLPDKAISRPAERPVTLVVFAPGGALLTTVIVALKSPGLVGAKVTSTARVSPVGTVPAVGLAVNASLVLFTAVQDTSDRPLLEMWRTRVADCPTSTEPKERLGVTASAPVPAAAGAGAVGVTGVWLPSSPHEAASKAAHSKAVPTRVWILIAHSPWVAFSMRAPRRDTVFDRGRRRVVCQEGQSGSARAR